MPKGKGYTKGRIGTSKCAHGSKRGAKRSRKRSGKKKGY